MFCYLTQKRASDFVLPPSRKGRLQSQPLRSRMKWEAPGAPGAKGRKTFRRTEIFFAAQAAKQGLGKALPNKFPARGKNRRIADFGTVVETCSKTAADCPCLVFPYIERTGQGLRPAVGGLFSFRQYDAGTGLCCPLAAAFSLSAKDTFQRPPATRWTGIFQNFFCLSNPGNRILATGGAENFSFHSPHHRS